MVTCPPNLKFAQPVKRSFYQRDPGEKRSACRLLECRGPATVEIAKALSMEFRILAMDEPTAALNAAEVARLFAIIERLKRRRVAVLYVSHRLREIFQIADRVTGFRDRSRQSALG